MLPALPFPAPSICVCPFTLSSCFYGSHSIPRRSAFHHTIANNDLYVLKLDCVSCSRINQVLTFDEPWIAVDVACFSLHADSTFTSMIYDCDVLPHVFLFHCKCIMIQTMSGLRRLDWCFVCFASRLHV